MQFELEANQQLTYILDEPISLVSSLIVLGVGLTNGEKDAAVDLISLEKVSN